MKNFSLPVGWRYVSLLDLVDVIGGVAYNPYDITNKGIRLVRGGNIQDNIVKLKDDDVYLPLSYKNENNSLYRGDIVLVASTGSVEALGRTATVWEDMKDVQIGAFLRILRPKQKQYAAFISAWLSSEHYLKYIKQVAKGTSINNIGQTHLQGFKIPIPLESEIDSISHVYSSLSNKIALNRAINRNLEALAKQLYDYWFVQFDFPDGNGRPYKSSGGKMVWNEVLKREVPERWVACRIKDFLRIFTGKKDVSKAIPGDYKFFSCAPDPITSNEFIYDGAAILVSGNGSYTGRVSFYKGKFDLYQRTYACVPIKDDNAISFFFYTLRYLFQPAFSGGKHGSSIPYIVLGDLADFSFAYDERQVIEFVRIVKSMFDLQMKKRDEIGDLIRQRDELLPLLMNGQVTID